MPADARREPLPQDAGHGYGRPPDGPPEDKQWAIARGFKSLFGWPPVQAGPALPPLTARGLRAQLGDEPKDGAVQRLPAATPGSTEPNVITNTTKGGELTIDQLTCLMGRVVALDAATCRPTGLP
eukprot:COSAG05_NODE_2104_length_3554_cov_6.450362_4_plen_125_part_00